jgi:hypothetical protein
VISYKPVTGTVQFCIPPETVKNELLLAHVVDEYADVQLLNNGPLCPDAPHGVNVWEVNA